MQNFFMFYKNENIQTDIINKPLHEWVPREINAATNYDIVELMTEIIGNVIVQNK